MDVPPRVSGVPACSAPREAAVPVEGAKEGRRIQTSYDRLVRDMAWSVPGGLSIKQI